MDSLNGDNRFLVAGFPHSDIHGSSAICAYPRLFAACHVLLRLSVPGHSPCALSSLTLRPLFAFALILRFFSFHLFPSKIELSFSESFFFLKTLPSFLSLFVFSSFSLFSNIQFSRYISFLAVPFPRNCWWR